MIGQTHVAQIKKSLLGSNPPLQRLPSHVELMILPFLHSPSVHIGVRYHLPIKMGGNLESSQITINWIFESLAVMHLPVNVILCLWSTMDFC